MPCAGQVQTHPSMLSPADLQSSARGVMHPVAGMQSAQVGHLYSPCATDVPHACARVIHALLRPKR